MESGADPELSWLLSRTYIQEGDWSQALAAWNKIRPTEAEHAAEPEPAPFVGEARCAECHPPGIRRRARQPPRRHLLPRTRPEGSRSAQRTSARPGQSARSRISSSVRGTRSREYAHGNRVFQAVIDYAFGSRNHFTTFLGRDDSNRSFMLRMSSYESPKGMGWDLATGLSPRPADEEEYLGKTIDDGDGARRCLFCHTTSFRAVRDEVGPEAADHSIGCEKCHGPGGHHVAAVESGFPDMAIACPGQTPPAQVNAICGRCHGLPQAGKALRPLGPIPPGSASSRVTLTWSRCFSESDGKLSCTTCHDPHRDAETSTARNESKCLSCHAGDPGSAAASALSAAATRQPVSSSGEQASRGAKTTCPVNPTRGCLECHMPRAVATGYPHLQDRSFHSGSRTPCRGEVSASSGTRPSGHPIGRKARSAGGTGNRIGRPGDEPGTAERCSDRLARTGHGCNLARPVSSV